MIAKRPCPTCHREFSAHLIAPVFISGESALACPICALEALRAFHGEHYEFRGELARSMYQEALVEARHQKDKQT